jgi:murein DD-endopeptidase MepM/ murein hydrolase activator NlpD
LAEGFTEATTIPSLEAMEIDPGSLPTQINEERSSTEIKVTLLPNISPTAMVTNTPNTIFEVCSPLANEAISELWEIVSDPYNPPPPGRDERHHGVDFAYYQRKDRKTIEGVGVQAILPGKVAVTVGDRLPYGNMIIIETVTSYLPDDFIRILGGYPGESLYHLYAHLIESPVYELGEIVECGEVIGAVGKTGYHIVNPHLHLELRWGPPGLALESMAFYDTSASQEEMQNYMRWRTSGEFIHFNPMFFFEQYLLYITQ